MTKFSQINLRSGLTGADVAKKMLNEHGIYDVRVVSVDGFLTDHYNPKTNTVSLSQSVANQNSISAIGVAKIIIK